MIWPPELLNHSIERGRLDGDELAVAMWSTETVYGSASRNTRSSAGPSTSPTAFARTVIRRSCRNLRELTFDRFGSTETPASRRFLQNLGRNTKSRLHRVGNR